MSNKRLNIRIKDNYRIIAISDIHGHLDIFKALLESVELQDEDHLVILGDFINKGPNSLDTLRYMMTLSKRPRTYILKGNHEYFICQYVYKKEANDQFLAYLKERHFQSIIHDMIEDIGLDLDAFKSCNDLNQLLLDHYAKEYHYINTLPVIAFIDDTIFVHGGYDPSIDIENDENRLLKFDAFNERSGVQDSRVVVGHWPTANMRKNRNSNAPFFNDEKHIISIDGGLGVKYSGELNALLIKKKEGTTHISYRQENTFKPARIKKSHRFPQEEKFFINYPDFDIEVIEKGNQMTLCRHLESGKQLSIFNTLLDYSDSKVQVITTYINHFLNLNVGDEVEVCRVYEDCALVKHNDELGWILKSQL